MCVYLQQNKAKRVVYAIAVLHNCSKAAANVTPLRKVGTKDILMKYCEQKERESSIAFVILLAMVNIMEVSEVKALKVPDDLLAIIVEYIHEAAADDNNHYAKVTFASADLCFNFHSTEQVDGICKLSKNPACRQSMVKNNVTEHLVQLMEIGDQTEQELACNAVWELLSEQTADAIASSPKLTDVVRKLKESGERQVADAANRLEVKLKQLLRSRRGKFK